MLSTLIHLGYNYTFVLTNPSLNWILILVLPWWASWDTCEIIIRFTTWKFRWNTIVHLKSTWIYFKEKTLKPQLRKMISYKFLLVKNYHNYLNKFNWKKNLNYKLSSNVFGNDNLISHHVPHHSPLIITE